MEDGQLVLDQTGCRDRCEKDGEVNKEHRCDCSIEAEHWLTSWAWSCTYRSGTIRMTIWVTFPHK